MSEDYKPKKHVVDLVDQLQKAWRMNDRLRDRIQECMNDSRKFMLENASLVEEIDRLKALNNKRKFPGKSTRKVNRRAIKTKNSYPLDKDELSRLMKMKGINRKDIADIAEVSKSAVDHWFAGRCGLKMAKAKLIADFFEVDISSIVRKK
jgi:hypothetical protein